jgi:3-hydroxybutyryl-CoA dehydratase
MASAAEQTQIGNVDLHICHSVVITAIDQKGRAKAYVTITKENAFTVIEAEIGGIVPGLEERKVQSQVLSEGDPTNGPTDTRQSPAAKPET